MLCAAYIFPNPLSIIHRDVGYQTSKTPSIVIIMREDSEIFGESSPTTASISSDMAAYTDFLNDDYPDDDSPSFHAMSTADGVVTVNTSSSATSYVVFPLG